MATRSSRTDPHQQMRLHLNSHPIETMRQARKVVWLIDAIVFVPAEDNNLEDNVKWRDFLIHLIDHFQDSE